MIENGIWAVLTLPGFSSPDPGAAQGGEQHCGLMIADCGMKCGGRGSIRQSAFRNRQSSISLLLLIPRWRRLLRRGTTTWSVPTWSTPTWSTIVRRTLLLRSFLRADLPDTSGQIFRLHLGGRSIFSADRVVHFFAMNADLLRSIDSEANFVATNINDGDFNVVTDHDRFIALTGQHQHVGSFLGSIPTKHRRDSRIRDIRIAADARLEQL
jgi:hypothetical protein